MANNFRKFQTLEELSKDYNIILMDTCSLTFSPKIDKFTIGSIFLKVATDYDYAFFLRVDIKKGEKIYVTSDVLDEYFSLKTQNYKKAIKKRRSKNRISLDLSRLSRDRMKQRSKLKRMFEEKGKVLKLEEDEPELYGFFYRKYSKIANKNELSETDFNFLISGMILNQKTEHPICLISNDYGIFYSWKAFLFKEKVNPKQFSFCMRESLEIFQKMWA